MKMQGRANTFFEKKISKPKKKRTSRNRIRKMVSFELGKKIEKVVISSYQRKHPESP